MTGQSLTDPERLADLDETGLLHVQDDETFQRYTRVASCLMDTPVSLVSLVAADHQHFVAHEGLPDEVAEEARTPLSHSFCQHVVTSGEPLVVQDARHDSRVHLNKAIDDLEVIAYLGVPIRTRRDNLLGSFCVIDNKPRDWSDDAVEEMEQLADLVGNEIELRRIGRELKASNQQLKEAEQRNDELIQMMLHDLRNPLFGISGGLELLSDSESLNDDDRVAITICEDSCRHMTSLLGEILDTNKLRLTHLTAEKTKIPAQSFLAPIINQEELTAKASSIEFVANLDQCPDHFFADESILRRILQNILVNAFKYTPKGGRVSLKVFEENGEAVFEVADTGPGIGEKELDNVFKKYSVGESGKKAKVHIGLGLTFCKAAIEEHGGHIGVRSQLGEGSTFFFHLPQS